ncbi:type VI immunity family protein [Burkholderia ubonensis]|uniref:type VI immunity family protein n=1 Tax=Burkholderia ubonensis TaxID=101571 RepID=UPI0009B509A6|nr:type VI immunity family protein [Burkholderia ubonensis]
MTPLDSKPILTPTQALERYQEDLILRLANNRIGILPGVIGTVFFERGSQPDVRRAILDCFDMFGEMFGEHLRGGKDSDLGKFTKRTAAGVQKIRRAITDTPSHLQVSVVRSSAIDQDTADEYRIGTLTSTSLPADYVSPTGRLRVPKGKESGLSYLKFHVPMSLITSGHGIGQYESFLQHVCSRLGVRGGYGGLSPILPYNYRRYVPQEWELASKFSGLEIDSTAHLIKDTYDPVSYEGESTDDMTAVYDYLHPNAKVGRWGFIKGVNWYTILGELFINRMGGEEALRAALARADIHIKRIGTCLLIRAGDFPRLGAPEEGLPEPYVFVNKMLRVLRDPGPDARHTPVHDPANAGRTDPRAWAARFDLPDSPTIPAPPTIVPTSDF